MNILTIKMDVCIQIMKANIHMQKANWTFSEKEEFWNEMKLHAEKTQQSILPESILMKDVKGYPIIQQMA